jgi:hypothetical protein
VFGSAKEVPADAFVDSLAKEHPVFDGGRFRVDVEASLKPSEIRRIAPGHLSTSLSFALLRLRTSGEIVLERRSDSERTYTLTGQEGASLDVFSHVARPRRQA